MAALPSSSPTSIQNFTAPRQSSPPSSPLVPSNISDPSPLLQSRLPSLHAYHNAGSLTAPAPTESFSPNPLGGLPAGPYRPTHPTIPMRPNYPNGVEAHNVVSLPTCSPTAPQTNLPTNSTHNLLFHHINRSSSKINLTGSGLVDGSPVPVPISPLARPAMGDNRFDPFGTPFASGVLGHPSAQSLLLSQALSACPHTPSPAAESRSPSLPSLQQRIMKTKLCVHHLHGRCARGGKCTFAHSVEELRKPPNLYKTRLCINFSNTAACPKGDQCRFAHGEAELRAGEDDAEGLLSLSIASHDLSTSASILESPTLLTACSSTPLRSPTSFTSSPLESRDSERCGRLLEAEAIDALLQLPEETRSQLVDLVVRTVAATQGQGTRAATTSGGLGLFGGGRRASDARASRHPSMLLPPAAVNAKVESGAALGSVAAAANDGREARADDCVEEGGGVSLDSLSAAALLLYGGLTPELLTAATKGSDGNLYENGESIAKNSSVWGGGLGEGGCESPSSEVSPAPFGLSSSFTSLMDAFQ